MCGMINYVCILAQRVIYVNIFALLVTYIPPQEIDEHKENMAVRHTRTV